MLIRCSREAFFQPLQLGTDPKRYRFNTHSNV